MFVRILMSNTQHVYIYVTYIFLFSYDIYGSSLSTVGKLREFSFLLWVDVLKKKPKMKPHTTVRALPIHNLFPNKTNSIKIKVKHLSGTFLRGNSINRE